MKFFDQTAFDKNLALTQLYCQLQLANVQKSTASILRSFNPVYDGEPLFKFSMSEYGFEYAQWTIDPFYKRELITELYYQQLQHKQENIGIENTVHPEGDVLVSEVDLTFYDGASEAESKGFFDLNDCPPIDTWIYIAETPTTRLLYAWVPQQFVALAEAGIVCNFIDNIVWLKNYSR